MLACRIEALEVRLARPARGDPGGVGLAAELIDAGAGARPERDPPLDRGAADAGQRGRFLGEWVDVGGVIDVESAAREETLDAPVDGGEQPRHLLVARGLGGVELEAPVFSLGEDAVQEEGVEVDVQLEAAPEALDHRHGAAPPVARAARSAAIEAAHGPSGDHEHRPAERVIVGEEIAQAVRQREHPLAHGNVRQDVIDEVCGLLRHAAAAAARTKAASFARERHEALEGTALAPNAREASAERAARQELAELSLDEAGEPAAIAAVGDLAQEGFQVLADDAMRTVPSAARGR